MLARMRDSEDSPRQFWERIESRLDSPSRFELWKYRIKLFGLLIIAVIISGLIGRSSVHFPPPEPHPVLTLFCGEESLEPKEADGRLDTEMSFVEYPTGEIDEGQPVIKSRDDCTRFEYKLKSYQHDPKQTEESDPQSQS